MAIKPKLVDDWKRVLAVSGSFWLTLAGVALFVGAELRFALTEQDYDPILIGYLSIGLPLAGQALRVIRQGLPIWLEWLRIIAVALLVVAFSIALARTASASSFDAQVIEQSTPVIAQNEGERLVAYLPTPIDRPTICFGSTKGVRLGDTATHEECIALLADEVRTYWFGLKPYFSSDTLLYRLTLLRAVAYLDTAYNCGVSAIGHSTAMRRLNAGNVRGGCTALGWWNKQGGRVVRGLVIRRKKAVRSCMVGVE